ncbi:PREDICTED: myoD family inhibitor [Nipponia nippon]|nr:PREDICTED: myoD family inhibitor [Nipponia nippon]
MTVCTRTNPRGGPAGTQRQSKRSEPRAGPLGKRCYCLKPRFHALALGADDGSNAVTSDPGTSRHRPKEPNVIYQRNVGPQEGFWEGAAEPLALQRGVGETSHPSPAAPKKEKPLEDDESRKVLTKGPRAELAGAPGAVTCQPQVRAPRRPPSPCTQLLQNGAGRGPDPGGANGEAGNGVFRPLPSTQKPHRKLQSHHSINSQSSKKSKGSSKSASSHIPIEAQEDCCVHCILSCLFCEFLTLCNIVLDCATCGSCTSEDSCICCCCCNSGECADCDLPCDMDCGIIDACCESADCLEICMECCGLCFSS